MSIYTLLSITLALLCLSARAQFISLSSSLTQCQSADLQWTPSVPPYLITVFDADTTSAPALERLSPTNDTSVSWLVDVTAGTSIAFALQDSAGNQFTSLPVQIVNSEDASCLDRPAVMMSYSTTSSPVSVGDYVVTATALLTSDIPESTAGAAPPSSSSLSIDPDLPPTSINFNAGASPSVFVGPVVSPSGTGYVTISPSSQALNSGATPSRVACLVTLLSLSAATALIFL